MSRMYYMCHGTEGVKANWLSWMEYFSLGNMESSFWDMVVNHPRSIL